MSSTETTLAPPAIRLICTCSCEGTKVGNPLHSIFGSAPPYRPCLCGHLDTLHLHESGACDQCGLCTSFRPQYPEKKLECVGPKVTVAPHEVDKSKRARKAVDPVLPEAYLHLRFQGENGTTLLQYLIPMSEIPYTIDELGAQANKELDPEFVSNCDFWITLANNSKSKVEVANRRSFRPMAEHVVLEVMSRL